MGKNDIINVLKDEYEHNPNRWLTTNEIKERLRKRKVSQSSINRTTSHLFKMASFKLIDVKGIGLWEHYKVFRYIPD